MEIDKSLKPIKAEDGQRKVEEGSLMFVLCFFICNQGGNPALKYFFQGDFIMDTQATSVPRMMTPNEVAKTGILTEYAIRRGIKDGSIPHVKIGSHYRINYDKLLRMLEDC